MVKVVKGVRPDLSVIPRSRPQACSGFLALMQKCWAHSPEARPSFQGECVSFPSYQWQKCWITGTRVALQQWHVCTSPLWLRMTVNSLVEVSTVDISCVLCHVIPSSVCIFLPVLRSCWYSAQSHILDPHNGWNGSTRDLCYQHNSMNSKNCLDATITALRLISNFCN